MKSRKKTEIDRRYFLAVCGTALLAGCTSDSETGSDGTGGEGDGDEGGDGSEDGSQTQDGDGEEQTGSDGGTGDGEEQTGSDGDRDTDENQENGDTDEGGIDEEGKTKPMGKKDGTPNRVTDPWSTYGYGLGNTGYSESKTPSPDGMNYFWKHYVEGQYSLPEPAVVDDTLYIGSSKFIYALGLDGKERWTTKVANHAHHFTPDVSDGTVYVGVRSVGGASEAKDDKGVLYALNSEDGSTDWKTRTPITSSVKSHSGKIYFSNTAKNPEERGFVNKLDGATGDEIWRFEVEEGTRTGVFSTPALGKSSNGGVERVYVTSTCHTSEGEKGFVHALEASTGDEIWRFETRKGVRVSPVLSGGSIYVGDKSGRMYSISSEGDEIWSSDLKGDKGVYIKPVIADNRVCVSWGGNLGCLSASTGKEMWKLKVGNVRRTGISAAGNMVYVGGRPLSVINLEEGRVERHIPVGGNGGAYGPPIVIDETMYVSACIKENALYDNYIYAIG